MSKIVFKLLFLLSGVCGYNLSDIASWGPELIASQLSAAARTSAPSSASSDYRSPRMTLETPENWNFISKPMDYYQNAPESSDNERRFYVPPERKYGYDTYKVTVPEQIDYHSKCKVSRSHGEDGLTQIANVVLNLAKTLFGVFVVLLLPLILIKIFFFPLKLFLLVKFLLKLAVLWPFLVRVFPFVYPTTSVVAKLAGPSTLEAARDLVDYLQREQEDANSTRSSKLLDIERIANVTYNEFGTTFPSAAPYCDKKMSCFFKKVMTSEYLSTKFIMSAAILLGKQGSGLSHVVKFLENRNEFKECVDIKCSETGIKT